MRRAAWPLLCALLIAASVLIWLAGVAGHIDPPLWMWRYDDWRREPWTLWTGPLLHFLGPHLLANALALTALAVLGAALGATRRDALALLLAWPLATLALTRWPNVGGYYGLASVVHAATAILALRAMATPSTRWLGLLIRRIGRARGRRTSGLGQMISVRRNTGARALAVEQQHSLLKRNKLHDRYELRYLCRNAR